MTAVFLIEDSEFFFLLIFLKVGGLGAKHVHILGLR